MAKARKTATATALLRRTREIDQQLELAKGKQRTALLTEKMFLLLQYVHIHPDGPASG